MASDKRLFRKCEGMDIDHFYSSISPFIDALEKGKIQLQSSESDEGRYLLKCTNQELHILSKIPDGLKGMDVVKLINIVNTFYTHYAEALTLHPNTIDLFLDLFTDAIHHQMEILDKVFDPGVYTL
jgi:hypothetical protein